MNVQIEKNGKKFLVSVISIGCEMLEITAYELVRPHWKFFRTKFFPFVSGTQFISDYPSIIDAVEHVLECGFAAEAHAKEIQKKWEEFEKPLDKLPKVWYNVNTEKEMR
jgi:hypothetical protein